MLDSHTLKVNALRSLHASLQEIGNKAPALVSELHSETLNALRLLRSPLAISSISATDEKNVKTKEYTVEIAQKAIELLSMIADCMQFLPSSLVGSALPADGFLLKTSSDIALLQDQAKVIVARCMLVDRRLLPLNSLNACRTWCLSQGDSECVDTNKAKRLSVGETVALAVMPSIANTISGLKIKAKKQWLLDTFDTFWMCPHIQVRTCVVHLHPTISYTYVYNFPLNRNLC